MAQKDGEASVEDILRSIKQVISREDGPRRSPDTFARDAARENGEPVPERPASFSPYSFQRHSPFGARAPESAAPEPAPEEESFDDSRSDVFDLRSLDSDAFVDDDDMEEGHVAEDAASSGHADEEEPIILPPPDPETGNPQWSAVETGDAAEYREAAPHHGFEQPNNDLGQDQQNDDEQLSRQAVDVQPNAETDVAGEPEPEPVAQDDTNEAPSAGTSEGLIAGAAADALRARFSALEQAAQGESASSGKAAPNPLEDMVRDMLRPMLKQWLDDNMPGLVEKIVEREIARITGRL